VITAVMLARMLKRAEWITSANVVILNAREIVGVFVVVTVVSALVLVATHVATSAAMTAHVVGNVINQ
jgi:hypothetical protein